MTSSKCCLLLVVIAAVTSSVKGTAEVMSHVTAHFGKALEECREEVRMQNKQLYINKIINLFQSPDNVLSNE